MAAKRTGWTRGFIQGVIDSELDFPVLDNRIFVHVSPELDDYGYELPEKP